MAPERKTRELRRACGPAPVGQSAPHPGSPDRRCPDSRPASRRRGIRSLRIRAAGGGLRLALHRRVRSVRRRFPTGQPDGPGEIGRRDGGHRGDRHRRGRSTRRRGRQAPTIGDLVQRIPVAGAGPHRADRGQAALRRGEPLYRRDVSTTPSPTSVLASQMARDARPERRRPPRHRARHVPRPEATPSTSRPIPAGAMVDGLVFANGETNDDWDGIWIVRTAQTGAGWSAEFAIPFKTLSFPAGETVWGFNISRTIQRKLEENRWTGARFQTEFFQISEAGRITNLGRPAARCRARHPPLHRAALAAPRHRRRYGRRQAGGGPVLQHHPEPQAVVHREHRLRRDGGRCAGRSTSRASPSSFPRSGRFFLQDAGRLQLRHHRHRSAGRHSRHRGRDLPVLQPENRPPRRGGRCPSTTVPS